LRRAAIVTNANIGHNGGPELDDGRAILSIRTKWAKALFADPETPAYVMAIAWAVHWFSDANGSGAALSNEQLEVICGISPRTATRGKAWLRDNGYVQLRVGLGTKTRFLMTIPHKGVATQATLATQTTRAEGRHADGAANLAGSQSGEVATQARVGGSQTDEGGSQSGQEGVATQAALSSKDNQEDIPDKKRGRRAKGFWQEAFNPDGHSVEFSNGKLKLLNGEHARWLHEFGGDERRLDLALIQIAPYLQPNTRRPLLAQVESQLARLLGNLLGRGRKDENPKESTVARFKRYLEEDKTGDAT
jgi:hypothetical protein